jgi:DNA processing protein
MCDCTVVVESAVHGGALYTANAANAYNREVMAFPGRTTDPYSVGCNALISSNQAILISSADDLKKIMNWGENNKCLPPQLPFDDLTDDEQKVIESLRQNQLHFDALCQQVDLPSMRMSSLLIQMELKGLIRSLPGHVYEV